MDLFDCLVPFLPCVPEEIINREKERARALRKTQWWRRRLSKGECHYCRKGFSPGELTMDHVVPLSRGGASTRGNVVPACKTCNTRKKYLLPIEWEDYMKTLSGQDCDAENEHRKGHEDAQDG